jgi:tRNA nucleotidyltransferase (CCA-adding enzyme)
MKISIPRKPKLIIDRLMENGYEAGLVGGCLRNLLLNLPVKDFDIATSASTEEMKVIFQDLTIISLGEKFGTLILVVEGENIEVTTFRKESSYLDNRHPDQVEFISNIEEDLKRRDFTINALYYNDITGLIDLFQSKKDLEEKIIRAVGNPMERFKEDSLRILRGLRFAARLNFTVEDYTRKAILQSYPLLTNIKSERIAVELLEIFYCTITWLLFEAEGLLIISQFLPIVAHSVSNHTDSAPNSSRIGKTGFPVPHQLIQRG